MSNEIRGISTSVTSDDNASRPSLGEPAVELDVRRTLKRWFEEVCSAGIIPVSLIRWQLTGKDEELRAIVAKESQ